MRAWPIRLGWGSCALLLVVCVGLVLPGLAEDASRLSLIEAVRRALSADDFIRADNLLGEALRMQPDQPELLELQADLWSRQGKGLAAVKQIQDLRQHFPGNAMYRLQIGIAHV